MAVRALRPHHERTGVPGGATALLFTCVGLLALGSVLMAVSLAGRN
ncbi:MAG: hypothetical protein M8354_03345 [Halalkalicoccus sp.]|nr:hypothetical protein [Halalkalicoccus sp.]